MKKTVVSGQWAVVNGQRSTEGEKAKRSNAKVFAAGIAVAILLCLTATAQPTTDTLTPAKAIAIVLERNPSIAQAKASLKVSQERTRMTKSANYPTISGVGDFTNIYPNPPINFGSLFGPLLPAGTVIPPFKFYPDNIYDAHLAVNWLLLDFGRRATAVQSSRVAETTTVNQLQMLRIALTYQVLGLFDAIALEKQSIAVKDEDIAVRDSHVKIVQRRIEAGSATEYDALRSEQQLAAAKNERIDLEDMLAKSYEALSELLGYPQDRQLSLNISEVGTLPQLNADSLIKVAYANRTDYANALALKRSAELQEKTAKLQRLPTLGVGGTVGYKNGILPDITAYQFNYTASAQLTLPLYTGGATTHQINAAQYNVQSADAALNAATLKIRTDVLQAKTDVESAYAKLDLSDVQVKLAEKALKQANLKYEAGVITNLDVLDAENSFAQAKLAYVRDQFRYRSSFFSLGEATGVAVEGTGTK